MSYNACPIQADGVQSDIVIFVYLWLGDRRIASERLVNILSVHVGTPHENNVHIFDEIVFTILKNSESNQIAIQGRLKSSKL